MVRQRNPAATPYLFLNRVGPFPRSTIAVAVCTLQYPHQTSLLPKDGSSSTFGRTIEPQFGNIPSPLGEKVAEGRMGVAPHLSHPSGGNNE